MIMISFLCLIDRMKGWLLLNEIAETKCLSGSLACFLLQANTQFWLLDYPTALNIYEHTENNFPYAHLLIVSILLFCIFENLMSHCRIILIIN